MKKESFIELKDGRYFIGWWFLQRADMNWFGTVFREGGKLIQGTSEWQLRYQFRYFHPQSTRTKDLDVKRLWGGRMKDYTEQQAFETFDKIARETAQQIGVNLDYSDLRSDRVEEIFKKLKDKPWSNLKEL